jgi:hypothetical protein
MSLFSMAVPAIACVSVAQQGNCCPDEGTPPCGECPEKAPSPSYSPEHCLAAPSSVTTTSLFSEPVRKLVDVEIEPTAIPPVISESPFLANSNDPIRHRWRPPPVSLETPTYLITGRLRL